MAKKAATSGVNVLVDRVADVHAKKLGWNLVVGIIRLYDFPNPWGGPESYNINMILEDQWVEVLATDRQNHLVDCIGHVVGKEDPKELVTKTWQKPTLMALYIEDLERNKMRCTLFEKLVGKVVPLLLNEDVGPLILVAQFFKPSVYLNEGYIQNTPHVS
ncbi:hypothetical protein PIB30_042359 [Stylosanthes scabra]|uniref:DUF223 domain-containing protein n=1 Tax=Stylosanthes scabra TaxID=79078 RepID=A0ABU6UEZ1_9FABA|nr:hypothetical protein [Stylosanthes scabra]